jgi:hypothetical protein
LTREQGCYIQAKKMSVPLKLATSSARAERRGQHADPWLTVSGWLWIAYVAGVAALAAWLWR